MISPAVALASGKAIIVNTKAIGQAMANCAGQAASHSAVGPIEISDMTPDIEAAIMKVIKSWVSIAVFLFIIQLSFWMDSAAAGVSRSAAAPSIDMVGAAGSPVKGDFIPLQRGLE